MDTINTLIRALDTTSLEYLVVNAGKSNIYAISDALLTKWNAKRSDVLEKPLLSYGAGLVSARKVENGSKGPDLIEVCYEATLGSRVSAKFRHYQFSDSTGNYLLFMVEADKNTFEAMVHDPRLQLALRSGGYALWDHNFDTGETYNSPEMKAIFGAEIDGQPLTFSNFNERIHPEDVDKTPGAKIRAAPIGTNFFQTRYRVKSFSGKYTWIESLAGLLRDPSSGEPKKIFGLCRNIDNEMLTVDRLRNSELMLKRTQAISRIGSFKLRIESGVSRLTAELAAMIGLADAIVHPNLNAFIKMIVPDSRDAFFEALEKAKQGRPCQNLEIAVKTASGKTEWFAVTMDPETGEGGTIENIFGACQLITQRKLLEDRIQQAQKMEAVGQLTGGIAHDFNNLLMVMMGNLQLVESRLKDDPASHKRIQAAMAAGERASNLTKRMLAYSRQQTLQNRELNVNELLLGMRDMVAQALTEAIELEIVPNAEAWAIKADRTMLETAVLNLAINARDAMSEGGKLTIQYKNHKIDETNRPAQYDVEPGDYVEISVSDTGTGISQENLAKIFQPFFTTKAVGAGSGLGLAMIYGFCKQSGGHIMVDSTLGVGTTFRLYLPRDSHYVASPEMPAVQAEAIEARPASGTADHKTKSAKVLIIEDNSAVRDVAAAMIGEMGLVAVTAADGNEGLETIEAQTDIDLILSDVVMAGGMHGPELAAKASQLRPHLKFLFMSGYSPESISGTQGLPENIDLVKKPFNRTELKDKVLRALEGKIAA